MSSVNLYNYVSYSLFPQTHAMLQHSFGIGLLSRRSIPRRSFTICRIAQRHRIASEKRSRIARKHGRGRENRIASLPLPRFLRHPVQIGVGQGRASRLRHDWSERQLRIQRGTHGGSRWRSREELLRCRDEQERDLFLYTSVPFPTLTAV